MGREIWTIIQDASGKTVWNSVENSDEFFCGRNDCTNVLAYSYDRTQDDEINFTNVEVYSLLNDDLIAQQERLYREHDRIYDCIQDAKAARRNTQTLEAFEDFTSYINEQQEELDSNNWQLGGDMMQLMIDTLRKAVELCCDTSDNCPAINDAQRLQWLRDKGWKVKWVISE